MMQFTRTDKFDSEPVILTFLFPTPVGGLLEQFTTAVTRWLQARDQAPFCHCHLQCISAEQGKDQRLITVLCQWLCKKCLPRLLAHVNERFPQVLECIGGSCEGVAIEIPEVRQPGQCSQFVLVQGKRVELEDGRVIDVGTFSIARWPVRVGEFRNFAKDTSYITTAERVGNKEVYFDNDTIRGLPNKESNPACYVSYLDAMAYCEWAMARLPTEAEWVAAAVIDDKIYDDKSYEELVDCEGRFKPAQHPDALELLGAEWTSTCENDQRVVIRRGPVFVREANWKAMVARHGLLERKDAFSVMGTFRVVCYGS